MWKPERTNGFQYMVRRDGEEISIDIDGSPPSQDGYPGGDQRSIINYHSHQQTTESSMNKRQPPHPVIQSQLPRPAFQSQTPRLAFQSQRPAFQSQPPRAAIQSQPPRAAIQSQPPRAAIQSQPPRAAIQSQPPRAAIQSQPPRAAIQSQPPRPVIRSQPPLPAIHSQHPRLAMHSLQGPPPAQSLPKQQPTTRNSETFRTSRYKGGIPGITQFITVGNKSVKFSEIIFNSGKDLLEEIITRSAGGLDVTPYSTASHLERLNTMYPTTITLDPKIVSIRIQSFMKLAKEKVDDSMRTGQGMRDDELYDQDVSREQTIVDLLKDAKRSTTPLNSTPSTTNSLSSKNYVNPDVMDALEEKALCFLCKSPDDDLQSTGVGEVCKTCLKEQGGWLGGAEEDRADFEEEARIQQNAALMMMDQPSGQSGSTHRGKEPSQSAGSSKSSGQEEENQKKKKNRKRRYSFSSDDESDKDLSKLLVSQLGKEDRKRELEILKLELEIQNLKKKNDN